MLQSNRLKKIYHVCLNNRTIYHIHLLLKTFINFRGTTEPIITPINLSSTIIRLNSKQWWASNSKVGVVVSLVYAWRIDEETVVVATIVEI